MQPVKKYPFVWWLAPGVTWFYEHVRKTVLLEIQLHARFGIATDLRVENREKKTDRLLNPRFHLEHHLDDESSSYRLFPRSLTI